MSESNILIKMTVAKARMIEELITKFLGHKPDWNERKAFRILNSLGESSIYLEGAYRTEGPEKKFRIFRATCPFITLCP